MKGRMRDRHAKDLRKLDNEDPAYWEEVLRREGLTLREGENRKLSYVGNSVNLEHIENKIASGRFREYDETAPSSDDMG